MEDLKGNLLKKLKTEQRGIKWFYSNYIESPESPNYSTIYHQIHGYIKAMPDVLVAAINKYLAAK